MKKMLVACLVFGSLAFGPGRFPLETRVAPKPGTTQNLYRLLAEGRKLTDDQARELEDAVKQEPDDLESRVELLAYSMTREGSPHARKARQAHVIWLIENQPRNPIFGTGYAGLDQVRDGDTYDLAKSLWGKHVGANPKDKLILGNSSAFLLLGRRDEAQALLERCLQLEPNNEVWHQRLAQLLRLNMNGSSGDERRCLASQAAKQLEQALKLTRGDVQATSLLIDLAKTSFEAGEYEKARGHATELLDRVNQARKGFESGNALNDGNLILGRLALVAGDVAAARRHLLAAGTTPGSPSLNSFGPNMSLAKGLLERGETQTVLEYFDLCAKFWSFDRAKLKAWRDAAKAGIIPDFQANLVY